MLKEYFVHMFECNWLLIVSNIRYDMGRSAQATFLGQYSYPDWYDCDFSFSRSDDWNESTTVYYRGYSLGEFQVHTIGKQRNSILLKIIFSLNR